MSPTSGRRAKLVNGDADPPPSENVLETFERLLRAATVAGRTGDAEVREWTALAALDAVDLGELLGIVHDAEADRLRQEIRAAMDDLERP